MLFKKNRIHLKTVSIVATLFIFCVAGYYIIGNMGLIYIKGDEGKKVYEFVEDMNMDGKIENVKFVNQYYSYYKKHTCDAEYTSNNIRIYLDSKVMYSSEITTLSPLINPKIVDLVETDIKKKQIYIHADGGGSAIPMDYYFYVRDENFVVNKIKFNFSN